MAEYDHTSLAFYEGPAEARVSCRLIAVCEDSQTELIPNSGGAVSPLVVRIRLVNETQRRGLGRWLHSNGEYVEGPILPGENVEFNIAPSRRLPLYRLECSLRKESA